jgi:hypothetical protein
MTQAVKNAFNRPHGVIFQKIELFITTAVSTSNSTILFLVGKPEGRDN